MADLSSALATLGLTLADLQCSADQIILFGSRAAGLGHARSDWDLLVVGEGQSRHTRAIDLVWVSPRELATTEWLTSELASHVARWGQWIHGAPSWVGEARPGEAARAHKAYRVASRLAAMEKAWDLLPPFHQDEYRTLVRRDLQRHAILARGEAVPPSPVLDEAWRECGDPAAELLRLASQAGVCSGFLEGMVAAMHAGAPPFESTADVPDRGTTLGAGAA